MENFENLSQRTIESSSALLNKGMLMFSQSTIPFQEKSAMHLQHIYQNCKFPEVVSAFLQKYN